MNQRATTHRLSNALTLRAVGALLVATPCACATGPSSIGDIELNEDSGSVESSDSGVGDDDDGASGNASAGTAGETGAETAGETGAETAGDTEGDSETSAGSSGGWSELSAEGAPSARHAHFSAWVDGRMLVWGGQDDGAVPQTIGGLYDPATDAWTAMAPLGIPHFGISAGSETYVAGAVGDEFAVWGGGGDGGFTTLLHHLYSPATDTWTPMSLDGAPEPRFYVDGITTSTGLVVFGGQSLEDGNTYALTSGATYDSATDAWSPIADWPRPRRQPNVNWTGTQMLVWGGMEFDANGMVASGDIYDAASDEWSEMSTVGEPSPRYTPSSVWTGSVLCVWGGFEAQGSDLSIDGACYDPQADTWTTMSATDQPTGFAAWLPTVWTGQQMVVWGWQDFSESTGMYDPAADSWIPTPVDQRPTARDAHTMVWTGSEVIIWGGRTAPEGPTLGDGARFTP